MDARITSLLLMSDADLLATQSAGEILAMGSIIMMNVITACTGLRPLLKAAPWEGQIAAVFHRSILCTAPGEHLLHLQIGPRLASPFSLRLAEDFASLLPAIPLMPGMPVRKNDQTIAIAETIRLSLEMTTYYQSPRYLAADVKPEALGHARQVVRLYRRVGGLDELPGVHMISSVMRQALADGNAVQMLTAASNLIGRGPGLTPSGDDFLVGCLRGLWLTRRNASEARRMLDHLRDALLPHLDTRTTPVGAEFIRYALEGAFAEVLDQAAVALLAPVRPPIVQSTVSHLLAQGETSGTDTILGLLTCLEALASITHRQLHRERRQDTATA